MTAHTKVLLLRLAMVALMCPTVAYAAVTLDTTVLKGTNADSWVLVVVCSLGGGFLRQLHLWSKQLQLDPAYRLCLPPYLGSIDMLLSLSAGVLAFAAGEAADINDWAELVAIAVAGGTAPEYIARLFKPPAPTRTTRRKGASQ